MIATFYRVTDMSSIDFWTDDRTSADKEYDYHRKTAPFLQLIEYRGDPVQAFIKEMNKVGGWTQSYRTLRGQP